jgi:hypothetical protein
MANIANPREHDAQNIGRGLLTSLALETALFRVAGQEPVCGSWPAWRVTDDRYWSSFGG